MSTYRTSGRHPRKTFITCLTGLLAFPAIIILGFFLLYLAGRLLIVSQPLKAVDAVVVLSGGEGRVEYASQVFQDTGAKWFIITETGDQIPGYPESVSEFDAVRAIRLGVPQQAIFITPYESSSTAGEAGAVRQIVADSKIRSVVVVTDPFHTRRAQLLFWKALRGTGVEIRMRAVEGHAYRAASWWLSNHWRMITFNEYAKIAFTLGSWVK